MTTIERMRAKRKVWNAGRYLEHQFNHELFSRSEQEALVVALHILAQAYNSLLAN